MKRAAPYLVLPVLLLAVLAVALLLVRGDGPLGGPLDSLLGSELGGETVPDERLIVERALLDRSGITALVRADGRDRLTVAQVQVDGAYWTFRQAPARPLARLETAEIRIPYPWVPGEAHHLRFVTNTGATFEYTIDVARTMPGADAATLGRLALIGLFVGVVPVALGMLALPAIRRLGQGGLVFAMALTAGLLAYLLVDTMAEGVAMAGEAASGFNGDVAVWLAAALTFAGLTALSRGAKGPAGGAGLATWLAVGIGLHNFGEGLSIGTALTVGNAALGGLLIAGFAAHNLTEGVAIVVPVARERARLAMLAALALVAGVPAILGAWIGAYTFAPHWGAVFFGVAAGAIAQVIVEVWRHVRTLAATEAGTGRPGGPAFAGSAFAGSAFAGFGAGVLVMYATAFLVQV